MQSFVWDPAQYSRFADERSRPYFDLLTRVAIEQPGAVYDAGCGSGGLTVALSDRWPRAQVHGFDRSAPMIEAARLLGSRVRFTVGDIEGWLPPADADVIVSNAALQWVPDHLQVIVRWAEALRPGRWLAFQVPGNFEAPSHRLMRQVADSARWRGRLAGVLRRAPVAGPAEYLRLCAAHGLQAQVWETTYLHVLTGDRPVLEWVRGTGLRPVLDALGGTGHADADAFIAEYSKLLDAAYPRETSGVVYPFRRIFCVARKR